MRDSASNSKKLWYATYQNKTPVYDENNDFTGDYTSGYSAPVPFRANLSATRGTQGFTGTGASNEYFGADIKYDRIISTSRMDLPIDEYTLIWTKTPATKKVGGVDVIDYDKADYHVTAVATGVRHMKYAVRSRQLNKANTT